MKAGIFTTTIEKIISLGPDLKRFKLAFAPGTEFDFDAGQFASIILPGKEPGKTIKRAYSIASAPQWKGSIELCLKLVQGGYATNYMWQLKEGDTVQIQAPLGRFVPRQPLPKTLVYVSTGTGIAPFRSIYHDLLGKGTQVEIWNIFGNRYETEIIYKEEFEELALKHPNFKNVSWSWNTGCWGQPQKNRNITANQSILRPRKVSGKIHRQRRSMASPC